MNALVIDIQSDVIEGTLVNFPGGEILYATTVRISRKNHMDGDYLTKMMLKAIEDLCLHMVKETSALSREPIHTIHYILSTPWVTSQSKTVKIEYEKDTEINEGTIHAIIEADRKQLIATYEDDMIFVEQKVFDVGLNGYSVDDYRGKKARTLKVSFAFTLSSDRIIQKIQSAVSKNLRVKKEFFHSAILLQYLSSRNMSGESDEYIVLHVHGELTDVVVVKKGFSSYLASFPFGASTLTRKTSIALKSTFEETSSTFALYHDKKLEEKEEHKITDILMPIMKGWQAECTRSFEEISKHVLLPGAVHLYSESPLIPLFQQSLEEMKFKVAPHEGPLRQIHIAALRDVI